MAYDPDLADRIRALVGTERNLTEQRMFGGLAFLVNGNMSVAASGQGGLLVRLGPDEGDTVTEGEHVRPMVMRGRPMRGWWQVDAEALDAAGELERWVGRGLAYARSLPPKPARA
ncbi:TfoX/Sxy family protein [Prauserella muralis]|uniref:RNA methyltransferase n=1 Tax=Prauserella muralis TaxID=588067 RepID=A0A2V4ATL2_9PSEU|nr:TfoX/Sxy family protein [Prauserella muralis]PXY22881.1 RNA methyltransferase [Prauserella muralis]